MPSILVSTCAFTRLSHHWTVRRHLFQRLEPPQLTHSNAKEQQLHRSSWTAKLLATSLTGALTGFCLLSSFARY